MPLRAPSSIRRALNPFAAIAGVFGVIAATMPCVLAAPEAPVTRFALVSPALLARLPAQADSPLAQKTIGTAAGALDKSPEPIPVLHVEGTLPHQGLWDVSIKALGEWSQIRTLALAYGLTGDAKYLDATGRFLGAWLDTYKVSFNPIDETNLESLIVAIDLTNGKLPEEVRDKCRLFLHDAAQGYLDRMEHARAEGKEDRYNWQSHRIKIAVLAAYALGDETLIARAKAAFTRQIEVNIAADGEVAHFSKRDALHYVTYDLEPLTFAALAAQAHGEDWLHPASPNGGSVATALDWLTPFALGTKAHDEFVHSTVHFDAQRAEAGMKGYSGPWDPKSATVLYQAAARLDPKYAPVLAQLESGGGHGVDWLAVLAPAGL